MKPAAAPEAKPAVRVAAVQPAAAPAMAASPAAQETPFYKRMFSGVSDLFSPSSPSQPTEAAPAAKPAPQKRAQASTGIKVVSAD
jgi:hypothetical protein